MPLELDILSNVDYISNHSNQGNHKRGGEKLMVLNVKDFPEDLHRKAKAEAALMGISLKELIIRAITEYLKKSKIR